MEKEKDDEDIRLFCYEKKSFQVFEISSKKKNKQIFVALLKRKKNTLKTWLEI